MSFGADSVLLWLFVIVLGLAGLRGLLEMLETARTTSKIGQGRKVECPRCGVDNTMGQLCCANCDAHAVNVAWKKKDLSIQCDACMKIFRNPESLRCSACGCEIGPAIFNKRKRPASAPSPQSPLPPNVPFGGAGPSM